ncbi:MAG TPA: hypothetical protein VFU69_18010 [Ktedonobacterales bacterium]|nr:hypothetical protein [Ktedonobacterales bacterium]
MALITGSPKPPSFPSGRYVHTNPLRREAGLRLLTESLPKPLRWAIIRAWRRPPRPVHPLAVPEPPSLHRQRPSEASLPSKHPEVLSLISLVELEMGRRLVEASLASISRVTRNRLLSAQGVYLGCLYAALAAQVGAAAALAEFQRLLLDAA